MSVFQNVDFSKAHEVVVCCIINYLNEGMQFGQKVSYINSYTGLAMIAYIILSNDDAPFMCSIYCLSAILSLVDAHLYT